MEALARAKLVAIIQDAEKNGISREAVARLFEARRPNRPSLFIRHFQKTILLALTILYCIYKFELYTREGLAFAISRWSNSDIHSDKCTIRMPDFLTRAFRPPVDCSICRDVHHIDRISNVSPREFENKYAFTGRPVIITDATKNWTAPSVFSFEFFKELYAGSSTQDNCQFFPYQTEFRSLWEVFQMSPERANLLDGTDPWYIGWSNCDDKVGRIIRKHYDRPYFLPETSENKNTDWIFMGSPGYGAHLHVDNVNHPSWQAQLTGIKNWTLEPPPECMYQCESHQVTIYPGEMFVLDTNLWYHSTLIVSEGISITIGAEYD